MLLEEGLITEDKTSVVENSSDPAHFPVTNLPTEPVVGMVSGCSPGRGFEMLIEACAIVQREISNLRLKLATRAMTANEKSYLETLRNRFQYDWLDFREDIAYGNVWQFLSECYVCVIPHPNTFYMNIALPIKLFDYMSSSRPVIVTRCLEMSRIVSETQCGLVCGFSHKELAEKLLVVLSDESRAKAMGKRGRKAIEDKFNWESRAKEISCILQRLD